MEENNLPAQTGLEIYLQQNGVTGDMATMLKESFSEFEAQAKDWEAKAKNLVITSVDQVEEIKDARIARLAISKVRISIEKKRKELKEDSLKTGRVIDGIGNYLKAFIEPIESHLEEQEKFIERVEAKAKAELKEHRIALLSPYEVDENFYPMLDTMDQTLFDKLLSDSKILFDAKKAAAEKEAEDKRLAEEKEAREKQEREEAAQIENERLKKENEEREKIRLEMEALQEKRLNELLPYINANTDSGSVNMAKLWEETEEQFQIILSNRKAKFEKLAKEKAEADAEDKRKAEEALKQHRELLKAAEERTSERKKALFALGLAETNGKMAFGDITVSADIIKDMESEPWGNYLTNVTNNVNAAKEKIEADRIAKEKADAEELEASKGDKEKFKNLHFELDALKKKYSAFKSKKHQKLSSEVNGLIQKIQDYITLKN